MLRIPTADVAMVMQFADRMGWQVDTRRSAVSRFINACSKNVTPLSDADIQAEVNAVRYKA